MFVEERAKTIKTVKKEDDFSFRFSIARAAALL